MSFSRLPLTGGAMRRWGLRGRFPIPRYKTCQRGLNLPNHLNPNGVWALVSCWVLFFICLIINTFKVAECINAGGKKGKLFCNFWIAGRFCANCKCAWPCAEACYHLSDRLFFFSACFFLSAEDIFLFAYRYFLNAEGFFLFAYAYFLFAGRYFLNAKGFF